MTKYVIDAWSFLAWFQDESPAADDFEAILADGDPRLVMSMMNAAEVYYLIAGRVSESAAGTAKEVMQKSPVELLTVEDDLAWSAARLNARYLLSIADAFAGALALERDAILVTGDDDFEQLEDGEGLDVMMLERDA